MGRATRESWAAPVERWRASGLTGAEFAQKLGASEKSLRWWKWRLKARPREPGGRGTRQAATASMSPLTLVEMTSSVRRDPMEVVLANGIRIRVPTDFDAAAMGRLLDVLERRR